MALEHYDAVNPEWSEAFTCRREVAIKAGLFPTGFPVAICAGEDGYFGDSLRKNQARKKIDHSIAISHVAPESFAEYWHIRKGRGMGAAQVRVYLQNWSLFKTITWALLRVGKTISVVGTVVPMSVLVGRLTRHSAHGIRDFFPFLWAWLVEQTAFHVGEWRSIIEISDKGRRRDT